MYLVKTAEHMIWSYDDRGLLVGEDVWEYDESVREIIVLDPAEVLTAEHSGDRRCDDALVGFVEEPFGVMEVVGGAGKWELGWWDPLGSAVGEFAGFPAFGQEFVVLAAREGEVVDVGGPAVGPFVDVVDFAEVAGHIAARVRAAPVLGVQHDSLVW